MRVRFDLAEFEPFTFDVEGERYHFSHLKPLARKGRVATSVHEYVYLLPNGKYVYLTVVADDEKPGPYGVARGWYVAEVLPEEDAHWLIKALAPFTAIYANDP